MAADATLPPASAPQAGDRLCAARGFLLDLDGTVFLGDRLIEGAARFLELLDAQQKPYLFITNNSSKDRRLYAEKLRSLGLDVPAEQVFTSGEAAALFLARTRPGARLFLAGTPSLEAEFAQHGFALQADSPEAVVLGYDTTLTYAKLSRLCRLVRAGLPYFATHPDINCPTPEGPVPDIGSTIAFVRASTSREPDLIFGKPNREMVEMAALRLGLAPGELAVAGDRLYTDIALGNRAGIPAVLVLSGETQPGDLAGSPYRPDYVFNHLGEAAGWLQACPPAAAGSHPARP